MNKPPPIHNPPGWRNLSILIFFLLLNNPHLLIESCPFRPGFIDFKSRDNVEPGAAVWSGILSDTEVTCDILDEEQFNFNTILECKKELTEDGARVNFTLNAIQPAFGNLLDFSGKPDYHNDAGVRIKYPNGTSATCVLDLLLSDENNQKPRIHLSPGMPPFFKFSLKERSWDTSVALNWEIRNKIWVTDHDHTEKNANVNIIIPSDLINATVIKTETDDDAHYFMYDVQLFATKVVNGTYDIIATDGENNSTTLLQVEIEAIKENLYPPEFAETKYYVELPGPGMPDVGFDVPDVEIIATDKDDDELDLSLEVDGEAVDYLKVIDNNLRFIGEVPTKLKGKTVQVVIKATETDTIEKNPPASITITIRFPEREDPKFKRPFYEDPKFTWSDTVKDKPLAEDMDVNMGDWRDMEIRYVGGDTMPSYITLSPAGKLSFNADVTEDSDDLGPNLVKVFEVKAIVTDEEKEEREFVATVVLSFPRTSDAATTTESGTSTEGATCEPCPSTTTDWTEQTSDPTATTPNCPSTEPPECPSTTPDSGSTPCDCSECNTETTTQPTTDLPTTPCDCPSTPDPGESPNPSESTTASSDTPSTECPSTTLDSGSTTSCDCSECKTTITDCPTTTPFDCPSSPDPGESPQPPESTTTSADTPSTECPVTECPITECPISTENPPTTSIMTTNPPECPPGCITPPTPCPEIPTCPTTTASTPCPPCTTTQNPGCPEPPTCAPTNCPEPPTCAPTSCPEPPTCAPCESGEADDVTCPPCDDCSTGGLIAATVVTSVLFISSVSAAGYLFWVIRKAAINPFSFAQSTPPPPKGPEGKMASSYMSPSNAPPPAQPSTFPPIDPQPNRFGGNNISNGTLPSRRLDLFGEEPSLDKTIEPKETGVSNPTFNAEESIAPKSEPIISPTTTSPSPALPPPITPTVSTTPVVVPTTTAVPPAKKSNLKNPKEIEPDYEDVPGTAKTAQSSTITAAPKSGMKTGTEAPRSRKVSRVLFAPDTENEYISIDDNNTTAEMDGDKGDKNDDGGESDSEGEYERL